MIHPVVRADIVHQARRRGRRWTQPPQQPHGPCTFVALVWVLCVCICMAEMLQNWMAETTHNSGLMQARLLQTSIRPSHRMRNDTAQAAMVAVRACKNQVRVVFDFAVVVVWTTTGDKGALIALGKSLRAWNVEADMLLLLPVPPQSNQSSAEHEVLTREGGWSLCQIESSSTLAVDRRLKAWTLTEYKAVALMEHDTLVVGDVSVLFTHHYPKMRNGSMGALDKDSTPCHMLHPHNTDAAVPHDLSTGVLLVIPSLVEYMRLKKKALAQRGAEGVLSPSPVVAFRHLLRMHYHGPDLYYALPPELNANIAWKHCNPAWWAHANLKVLHYTIAKPWEYDTPSSSWAQSLFSTQWNARHPWACWLTGTEELCQFWKRAAEAPGSIPNRALFCWEAYFNYKKNACGAFI
jgi:hypothetical protein